MQAQAQPPSSGAAEAGGACERAAALLVVIGVEDTVADGAVEGSIVLHQHDVEHLVRGRVRVS